MGTISTNEVFPAANDITAMQIQSGDTIRIKPGCYMGTMDHVISADESETIEVSIKTIDWAGEIMDLFPYGNQEAIHQAVPGLQTRYNGEFDATILLDQLDNLQTPDLQWAFTSPAAMIGAAICIFALGICLLRCCRQAKEDSTLRPTTPPMPCQSSRLSCHNQPPLQEPDQFRPKRTTTTTEPLEATTRSPSTSQSPKKEHHELLKKEPRRRGEISEMIYL